MVPEISPQKLQEMQENNANFLLLDCREQQEYDTVHIKGCQLIPMSELRDRVEEIKSPPEQEIVVYCHHGVRSQRVAYFLSQIGYTDVKSLAGGIDRWSLEIDPSLQRY